MARLPKTMPLAAHLDGRPSTIRKAAEFLAHEIQGDVLSPEHEIADAIERAIRAHRKNAYVLGWRDNTRARTECEGTGNKRKRR